MHAGHSAPLPCGGGSEPRDPVQGPTLGAAVRGRCAGPEPRAFGGVGRGGVGGRGRRGPAGPGSAGSEASAQAARRAGHEPRPLRVGGSGPRRRDPRTPEPEPGTSDSDPSRPRRAGAPRGQGRPGAATELPPAVPAPLCPGPRGPAGGAGRGSGSGTAGSTGRRRAGRGRTWNKQRRPC